MNQNPKPTAVDIAKAFILLNEEKREYGEPGLTCAKLQILCYFAQAFHAALYVYPLFSEDIHASAKGPVVPSIHQLYGKYWNEPIPVTDTVKPALSEQEERLVADVFQNFGEYSAWRLAMMMREEKPWFDYHAPPRDIPLSVLREFTNGKIIRR